MIDREKVHSLVGVFYQPVFKTFYVNSQDGISFSKPLGVFVSLGITTSKKVIENICVVIDSSKEYSAKVVEISSKKVEGKQFLNTVTNDNDPNQYHLENIQEVILDRDQAMEELKSMREKMDPKAPLEVLREYAPKVSRLQYFVDKLDESDGWDAHRIQVEDDGNYRIYHLQVNYKKVGDIEYRLGIYVTEKD